MDTLTDRDFFQEDLTPVQLHHAPVQSLLKTVRGATLIHADPPWTYDNKAHLIGPSNPETNGIYDTISLRQIVRHVDQAFDCAADDARLVLWITFPFLQKWFYATETQPFRWEYKTAGCWHKAGGVGVGVHWRGRAEPVLVYVKGKPHNNVRALLKNSHNSLPEQHSVKPSIWIAQMLRKWTQKGDLVMDMYSGTAPAALACIETGRQYQGAEIDADRHALALQLMKEKTDQL